MDCIDNTSFWWEEEEERIWESDSVWEWPWDQPIYSPPPSPTSVFLISPQLYFSLPPPPSIFISPTPQLHFSPPPTTAVLMSPYLDFSPPPPPIFLSKKYLILLDDITAWKLVHEELLFPGRKDTRYISVTISFYPPQDYCGVLVYCGVLGGILKFLDEILSPWRRWLLLQRWLLKCDRLSSLYLTIESEEEPEDFEGMTQTSALESIPLRFFLPPKSPKMVSIWSCLSVVKISRKISIRLLQVLPSVQLPQTLHIVIVEEKMTQLLSCSGEFISQDCSLVEERSVEITVEVDATNNGAHGVKAYENFPIVSHLETKNTRDKLKRNYKSISVLTLEDLQKHFGSKLEAVAKSFGVSKSTLKRKCRRHGISQWPFQPERKKERLMEVISPSMHEKHDSRLRCIRTPLHARSSPRTTTILDGGEMVQLDSSKQQSLVEFNVTNNSAHLVRASQSCSTVSHSDETNSRETLKRKCPTESALSFEDLQQHFGCKRDDAAKALGVSVSTVKRTCRQHGIPQWPSRKKKKVSERDCMLLLEPEREKNGSPIYKTPTVGIVLDFIEGPNLSNTKNHSNEESITTPTFQDSVPIFERDCILFEPQGEKNVSPTHKTPTNGQTEVGNGMVEHIQDQNGIVPEFIEGPNLSNTKNRSNEKSLTAPNFQDSVPSNYPAMDLYFIYLQRKW